MLSVTKLLMTGHFWNDANRERQTPLHLAIHPDVSSPTLRLGGLVEESALLTGRSPFTGFISAYQIDVGITGLLWLGKERPRSDFQNRGGLLGPVGAESTHEFFGRI